MNLFYIFILIFYNVVFFVDCKKDFVPVLIWTSGEFEKRPYLDLKQIRSDSFDSYLTEILKNKNPFVVLFLEEVLSPEDFEWGHDKGFNSFPFLKNLATNSRVDYFKKVELPYKTINSLTDKGYKLRLFEPDIKFENKENVLLLVEFMKIENDRPETLKRHDEKISDIHKYLKSCGKEWICIYTAKETREKDYFSGFKQISSWYADKFRSEKPVNALTLYQDFYTGFTLITRGSIQLYLPTDKKSVLKVLENYLTASAKRVENKIDFTILFPNYTLNIYLTKKKETWTIDGMKIKNENEDSLVLSPKTDEAKAKDKCHTHELEFQNYGDPVVKVKLLKYKFVRLQLQQEPCESNISLPLLCTFILASILLAVICWNALTENRDFKTKSNIIRLSTHNMFSYSKHKYYPEWT